MPVWGNVIKTTEYIYTKELFRVPCLHSFNFPGVLETLTTRLPISELIRLDFPAFGCPTIPIVRRLSRNL